MPYSDNMYSLDNELDSEDFANELSPSDGYFPATSSNISQHVPNVFVTDPTLEERYRREAESKAREAAGDEERPLSTTQTRPGPHSAETSGSASPLRHHPLVTYSRSSASQSCSGISSAQVRPPSLYPDAPPAYTPSSYSPIHSQSERASLQHQNRPRNYNTFAFGVRGIMGVPDEESERLLTSQPESMGAPVDEERGAPSWANRARRRVLAWFRWKHALLALVVLIVSIAVLSGRPSSRNTDGDDGTLRPGAPVEKDPQPKTPGDNPADAMPAPRPETPFRPTFCRGEQHRYDDQVLSLDFSRSLNVTFTEYSQRQSGTKGVHVAGQVNIRRLAKGGEPRMVLEAVTNEPELLLYTSLDRDEQSLTVAVPDKFESSIPSQRACVELKGTIWAPEDAELGILSVRATHLDILLFDDISLRVADYSELSTVIGDIRTGASEPASYEEDSEPGSVFSSNNNHKLGLKVTSSNESWQFDSRIIEVSTTSGNIGGTWPLYDMLGLHSKSGNIHTLITPQDELAEKPKPAVLSISTISGTISAREPVHSLDQVPRRDYLVDITSTAGNVEGALAFSSGITVRTTSSDITLDLLPVINTDILTPDEPAQLETLTTSGTLVVRVLEPVLFDGNGKTVSITAGNINTDTNTNANIASGVMISSSPSSSHALDCLDSTHKSTSGNIILRYPQAWEGTLSATTTSGQLRARGKDLKIINYTGGWPGSRMEARKGPVGKKSTIEVHPLLGKMDAIIGDEA